MALCFFLISCGYRQFLLVFLHQFIVGNSYNFGLFVSVRNSTFTKRRESLITSISWTTNADNHVTLAIWPCLRVSPCRRWVRGARLNFTRNRWLTTTSCPARPKTVPRTPPQSALQPARRPNPWLLLHNTTTTTTIHLRARWEVRRASSRGRWQHGWWPDAPGNRSTWKTRCFLPQRRPALQGPLLTAIAPYITLIKTIIIVVYHLYLHRWERQCVPMCRVAETLRVMRFLQKAVMEKLHCVSKKLDPCYLLQYLQ